MSTRLQPLKSARELLQWTADAVSDDAKCTLPLHATLPVRILCCCGSSTPAHHQDDRPLLLACHDMAGGYHEDAHLHGAQVASAYRHCHWQATDIFCYFSHALVTIPPPGWTTAAHRNNTMMLGTFITEWEAGAATCRELFGTAAAARHTAQQLAHVAACFGFDGWLVNIENELDTSIIDHVLIFLRYLRVVHTL